MPNKKIKENHRFLDEAGDSTFYGKGKTNIIGTQGVSRCFILGMVKHREPLDELRLKIDKLQQEIAENELFQVPSVIKKRNSEGGYYFHATDDLPEVRLKVFEMIKQLDCSFEAVVGRKDIERYETKHKEEFFYADLLSHLLKNKLAKGEKMVLHIAEKGKSTKNSNLDLALRKAIQRYQNGGEKVVNTSVVFNVAYPTQEPLLNVADYFVGLFKEYLKEERQDIITI